MNHRLACFSLLGVNCERTVGDSDRVQEEETAADRQPVSRFRQGANQLPPSQAHSLCAPPHRNLAGMGTKRVTVTSFLRLFMILELYQEISYLIFQIARVAIVVTEVPNFVDQECNCQ